MSSPQVPDSIRALFDSCRDDFELAQPAMHPLRTWLAESEQHREALQAMRRMDERIQVALHEGAIPVGLKQRILRSVGAGESGAPTAVCPEDIDLSRFDDGHVTPSLARNGVAQQSMNVTAGGRPVWLALGASLATLSAVVFVVLSWGRFQSTFPSSPSARALCEASLVWIQIAKNSSRNSAGPNAQEEVFVGKRKLIIQTDYGHTECYLTSFENGIRVYQFRFRVDGSMGLPKQIPRQPDLPTAHGFVCSAYQIDDEVIVTAVEGDFDDYQHALAIMINGVP